MDLGSEVDNQCMREKSFNVMLTVGVILEDLYVHVCVGNNNVQLLFERQEFAGQNFEVVFASTKKHHLIRLFLQSS